MPLNQVKPRPPKVKPRKKLWSDKELVKMVAEFRAGDGECSVRDLARATGMSSSAVHTRVRRLVDEGRLLVAGSVGSIRTADELLMRELPDGRLVEVTIRR